MPRKRHVSRNVQGVYGNLVQDVMPRKRHVSRNDGVTITLIRNTGHASQEACE